MIAPTAAAAVANWSADVTHAGVDGSDALTEIEGA